MNRDHPSWKRFLEKLTPATQNYLGDAKRKTWGLALYFVRPFSLREATYASLLGRLLESSSEKYPSLLEISRREEELYDSEFFSEAESYGDRLIVSFHLTSLREEYVDTPLFAECVEYMEDVLFSPNAREGAFAGNLFEVERERLLDDLASFRKEPMNLAYAGALSGAIVGELGQVPMESEEILREMTPASVWAYYTELFTPGRAHLLVKGMSSESSYEVAEPLGNMEIALSSGGQIEAPGDFAQSLSVQMYASEIQASDPRAFALSVFTLIWGGGSSSRLFEKVREERGLCYGISADYSRSLGLVSVSAAFDGRRFAELKEAIGESLEGLVGGELTAARFAGAKQEIRTAIISRSEGIGSAISDHFYRSLLGESTSLEERLARLDALRLDEVLEAGATLSLHSGYTLLGGES